MKLVKRYIFLFSLLIITACIPDEPIENNNELFNIKNYFLSEIEKLENDKKSLTKTIAHQNENSTETLTYNSPDWNKEFKLFLESDVSNKAVADYYQIDTIKNKINYLATNEKVSVKKLNITFTNDALTQIDSLYLLKSNENIISKLEQQLNYSANKNYSISIKQKMPFSGVYEMNCKGEIY